MQAVRCPQRNEHSTQHGSANILRPMGRHMGTPTPERTRCCLVRREVHCSPQRQAGRRVAGQGAHLREQPASHLSCICSPEQDTYRKISVFLAARTKICLPGITSPSNHSSEHTVRFRPHKDQKRVRLCDVLLTVVAGPGMPLHL